MDIADPRRNKRTQGSMSTVWALGIVLKCSHFALISSLSVGGISVVGGVEVMMQVGIRWSEKHTRRSVISFTLGGNGLARD